jgi:hypothetical protein
MKIFILLICGPALLSPIFANEIIDPDAGKQFATIIKDVEVEDMLNNTSEFKDCRDFNKFEAGESDPIKTQKIQRAEKCFRDKLTKGKSEDELKKLSEQLNLQQFGLVKSKSSQDLQKYLNDKMYKSMTGVDPNEKNLKQLKEDLKFGKKKHIDQAVFIEMYKTQLGKNALYEVSRFCFENLRSKIPGSSNASTFAEHWSNYTPGSLVTTNPDGSVTLNVDDSSSPKFGTTLETEDKNKIYEDIFKSIQGANGSGLTDALLKEFFLECGKTIVPLCEVFQKTQNVKDIDKIKTSTSISQMSSGATACLTKSRLQSYRKAIGDATKVADYFSKEMKNSDKSASLYLSALKGEPVKIYGRGADDETVDDLTNYASKDFIEGGLSQNELFKKAAEECQARPELSQCEGIISNGESFEKAKHDVEQEMTLKREVEMARIRELKKNKESLEKYLEENGYADILDQFKKGKLNEAGIEEKVGQAFEAKKIALLQQMNAKLGKRQVQVNSNNANTQLSKTQVDEVIQETKEERARLAQVVLFNNIITGHLELKKEDGSTVGRNVNVWKKEERGLESSQINSNLFRNIKSSNADAKGLSREDKISGFQIIDSLLGKPDK